ncbi:HNH endonuclease [Trujillonella humicola]|uniref:HNH endonuclease n=1 Tax=Trujillonella humicola TaxID=3383699 RepID=UPI003905C4FE
MADVPPLPLDQLPEAHRRRLAWFAERAGEVTGFPGRLEDGSFLVSAPKGIYKPADLEYALSIRINLDSPYPDGEVRERADGSWFFAYHQEGADPQQRDREYTNRGLLACMRDGVPVGVLQEQPPLGRRPQYRVLGLGRPVAWQDGYFFFESVAGSDPSRGDTIGDVLLRDAEAEVEAPTEPPADDYDARRRTYREVVTRRGQPAFRRDLLGAYRRMCAITGCTAEAVLEAAHLRPYRGPASNTVTNGLLLRADIHTLLDLALLAIHPTARTVTVSRQLAGTEYAALAGRRITEPAGPAQRPADEALGGLWRDFEQAESLRQ